MNRRIILAAGLVMGLFGLGLCGRAQDPQEHSAGFEGHDPQRIARHVLSLLENDRVKATLNLTDPQTDRLRQIVVETEKATVKTRAEMAVRGIELRELLRLEKPDREAAMKKVQELADLHRDMMRQGVDALLAAKDVLTPEQQKKIRSFI